MARRGPVQPTLTAVADAPLERVTLAEVVEDSFLVYSMSVITDRALPDVRDGLKPVHRRILWGMSEAGYRPDRPHVKCARVSGEVMGRYHPHGDAAIYLALIRMAQPFSLLVPLIDPHGNVGSPADPPAAARYVECRLAEPAMLLLAGIDEGTVDMTANFDGSMTEPVVLPARFPNLLVNGAQGIAVGVATNIPPHNPGEVIAAALHLIDHPEATSEQLAEFLAGPDFPGGGLIMGGDGYAEAYRTGHGRVRLRAKTAVEASGRGQAIVVTEVPYQTSTEGIAEKAAELVEAGTIEGVRDIRDESAGGGCRLVFELKAGANAQVILANLFKHTPMQTTVGMNMVALDGGVPRSLSLREMLSLWQAHQEEVLTRRSQFRLAKAEARFHIVEGLLRALDRIDEIVAAIRASKDRAGARAALLGPQFGFSEAQAEHILDLTLARLTQLGRSDLEKEAKELGATIRELKRILATRAALLDVLREELADARDKIDRRRRTVTVADTGDIDAVALVADEPLTVTVTHRGYIKAVPERSRAQRVADPGERDAVRQVIATSTLGALLVFTNRGKVYKARGADVPRDRLTALPNLFSMGSDEHVVEVVNEADYEDHPFVLTVTDAGMVKKTLQSEFAEAGQRKDGAVAAKINGDQVVAVLFAKAGDGIMLMTRNGQAIRFSEADARPMGRNAAGVRGINLSKGDPVVAACALPVGAQTIAVVTSTGYAKRTRVEEVPVQARGGKGVRAAKLNVNQGHVVALLHVAQSDQVSLVNEAGAAVVIPVTQIQIKNRESGGGALEVGAVVAAVVRPSARG